MDQTANGADAGIFQGRHSRKGAEVGAFKLRNRRRLLRAERLFCSLTPRPEALQTKYEATSTYCRGSYTFSFRSRTLKELEESCRPSFQTNIHTDKFYIHLNPSQTFPRTHLRSQDTRIRSRKSQDLMCCVVLIYAEIVFIY